MSIIDGTTRLARPVIGGLERLAPLADLGIRLWAAKFFWDGALSKVTLGGAFPFIHMNPSTITLFEYEYEVPLLSPEVAAYLGTATEFTFPILLAFGLGGRLAATVLFAFNIVAVIAYPALEQAGVVQHQLYGTLLLVPLLRGPGKISIDHFIRRHWMERSI